MVIILPNKNIFISFGKVIILFRNGTIRKKNRLNGCFEKSWSSIYKTKIYE